MSKISNVDSPMGQMYVTFLLILFFVVPVNSSFFIKKKKCFSSFLLSYFLVMSLYCLHLILIEKSNTVNRTYGTNEMKF